MICDAEYVRLLRAMRWEYSSKHREESKRGWQSNSRATKPSSPAPSKTFVRGNALHLSSH